MAFTIQYLDNITLEKGYYLFDANIWIKILYTPFSPSNRDKKYLEFFGKFQANKNKPKIALPTLILSEVINRIMREFHMTKYMVAEKIQLTPEEKKGYYKSTYRKTEDFRIKYGLVCDEIKQYHQMYELVNDGLGEDIKSKHLLVNPPSGLDFNDYFYFQLAKKNNYTIITDDSDFFVEGVTIGTYNPTLYQKWKDSIKPTDKK